MRWSVLVFVFLGLTLWASEWDREPIEYSSSKPNNDITQLQKQLDTGKTKLKFDEGTGYLKGVLQALDIPVSSQILVFSKTSLQRDKISPRTPRAIYFNDETFVGFCLRGEVLEISTSDPKLGTVYYTLDQDPRLEPKFKRHTENCLVCHTASRAQGVPGHVVRSVYPDKEGNPILSGGSFRIDHTNKIKERWGGWYVSGTHGVHTHLGNLILQGKEVPETINNKDGENLKDLRKFFDTGSYLSQHSDIVALMVFEHQCETLNKITSANFQTRLAMRDADIINKLDEKPLGVLTEGAKSRINGTAEQLVKSLLFCEEAPLVAKLEGTSDFAKEFGKRGPTDSKGRSLRDLQLQSRIFKYPCSYLIYSKAFDALSDVVKERVYQRLWDVLNGKEKGKEFAHLREADRNAIREILIETKKGLPAYWK